LIFKFAVYASRVEKPPYIWDRGLDSTPAKAALIFVIQIWKGAKGDWKL
jgi:hypothetical protein